jgi:hypothetical protein
MDPDPAIFFIDLYDANKKLFFCAYFIFEGTFIHPLPFVIIRRAGTRILP